MYWITLLPPAGCKDSQITLHLIAMKLILPDYAFIHAVAFAPSVPRTRGHLLLCSLIDMHGKIRGLKVVVFVYYQRKFLLLWRSALSWADRRQHPGVTAHRLPTVPHFSLIHLFLLRVKCVIFEPHVGSTLTYRAEVSWATQMLEDSLILSCLVSPRHCHS